MTRNQYLYQKGNQSIFFGTNDVPTIAEFNESMIFQTGNKLKTKIMMFIYAIL